MKRSSENENWDAPETDPERNKPSGDRKGDVVAAQKSLTRHLAFRDHSRFELETKLSRRFTLEVVAFVLDEAERKGWLPQPEEITARLVDLWRHQSKSPRYIENELQRRHLPLPVLDRDEELTSARTLLHKKFGSEPLSDENKNKAIRFLNYRGFSESAIEQVLNEV